MAGLNHVPFKPHSCPCSSSPPKIFVARWWTKTLAIDSNFDLRLSGSTVIGCYRGLGWFRVLGFRFRMLPNHWLRAMLTPEFGEVGFKKWGLWWNHVVDLESVNHVKPCSWKPLTIYLAGALEHEFYFPFHIWDVILPIDELHHFSRWWNCTTNQVMSYKYCRCYKYHKP